VKKAWEAGVLPPTRSDEAVALVARLVRLGWSSAAIGSAAGIPRRTLDTQVQRVRDGEPVMFQRATADRLLRLGEPTAGFVGSVGPSRRLRGLARMGWALDDLSAVTGLPESTLAVMRRGDTRKTTARAAVVVARAYDALSMVVGPSPDAAVRARAAGWVAPLGWDEDDDLDDPDTVPTDVVAAAAPHPRALQVHVDMVVEQLDVDPGATLREVAARLGVRKETLRRHLHRHGHQDLLDRMTRNAVANGAGNQHTKRVAA